MFLILIEFVVFIMMFPYVTGLKTNRLTPDGVVFMVFLIVTGLKTNELSPDDVEFVVCTHGHSGSRGQPQPVHPRHSHRLVRHLRR